MDQPPKTQIPASTSHAAKSKPPYKRVLAFVKEWGGVATVLIAILYTFPFDAAAKFVNWREQSILDARKALSEVAALYAAETSATATINDPQAKSFLANTYNIRIYNLLSENQTSIAAARDKLLSSELYMVGSLYILSGFPEGLTYYHLALKKSTSDAEKITIYREIGNALFTVGPNQNIAGARDAYVHALNLASKIPYLLGAYIFDLSELGAFELINGDWKCGQYVSNYALSLFDAAAASNPSAQQMDTYFHNVVAAAVRKPNQPATGCAYQVPLLPNSAIPIEPSSTAVSVPNGVPQSGEPALSEIH